MPTDPKRPTDDGRAKGSSDFLPVKSDRGSTMGEILLREKLINVKQLEEAQRVQGGGEHLTHTLAKLGYLEESQLINFLSRQYGVPSINLDEVEVTEEVIKLVPKDVAQRHKLVPIARQGATLIVAMTDPGNIYAMDDIKFLTGLNVEVVVASETAITSALERYYGKTDYDDALRSVFDEIAELDGDAVDLLAEEAEEDLDQLKEATEDAPVVRLVNMILVDAVKRGASDIHVESYEKDFRVRYRMDGVLYEIMKPPLKLRNAITSRLKIMAELDIAERRLPQDGRIRLVMGRDKEVDFRVSVLPCLFGEKVVLRILDKSALKLDLAAIGFEENPLKHFREAIHQPWGMVLVTGPTGSGKSTTLYAALSELNTSSDNISTAEDPVEMNIPGINQVHVREEIGLSFAAALRSFLRQDPDIIMVGEIRDSETARVSIQAALTGHLVLSTLHTNSAPGAFVRLADMGIERYLLASAFNGVVAQRLARTICPHCRTSYFPSEAALADAGWLGQTQRAFSKGEGCKQCHDSGFRGRAGIYEILEVTEAVRSCIHSAEDEEQIKAVVRQHGWRPLREEGLLLVEQGRSTLEEVLRVTHAETEARTRAEMATV